MLRQTTYALTALSLLAAPMAATAQSREEIRRDRRDVREEQRDVRDAQRYGDRRDVRNERRDVQNARQELREDRRDRREWRRDASWDRSRGTWGRYDYNRPDPRYGAYYADRYYSDGNYQTRRLSYNDRVYRGNDGRYYCRRADGTTGLLIGALGGGVLGNAIAPGGSKTLGTVIGGGLGAILGQSIARDGARCR